MILALIASSTFRIFFPCFRMTGQMRGLVLDHVRKAFFVYYTPLAPQIIAHHIRQTIAMSCHQPPSDSGEVDQNRINERGHPMMFAIIPRHSTNNTHHNTTQTPFVPRVPLLAIAPLHKQYPLHQCAIFHFRIRGGFDERRGREPRSESAFTKRRKFGGVESAE